MSGCWQMLPPLLESPKAGSLRAFCSFHAPGVAFKHNGGSYVIGKRLGPLKLSKIQAVSKERAKLAREAMGRECKVLRRSPWDTDAVSHTSGVQLLFLGTGTGGALENRRSGSLALKLSKSIWLFDCGEDTQRQLHKQPLIRCGKLDRIFITNNRTQNLLGLPGMLCTMSGAREIGLDAADIPIQIFGPPGLAEYLGHQLRISDTYISMPIIVHEFVDHAVDPSLMSEPELVHERGCLYRVLIPPDKLNPKGYFDGRITPFLSRAVYTTNKANKGLDERVNPRKIPLPPPGNPSAQISESDLKWTISMGPDQSLTAVRVPASVKSWAYVWREADRVGKMDVEACKRLQVFDNDRAVLKSGESIINRAGVEVHPNQVIGEDIKGRHMAFIGESNDSMALQDDLEQCDLIIHAASCKDTSSNGKLLTRSCIDQAANLLAATKSSHLLLYRFKPNGGPTEDLAANTNSNRKSGATVEQRDNLNPVGSPVLVKRETAGGIILATRPNPPQISPNVLDATTEFVESIAGRRHCVNLAEDLDLYSVERNMPEKEESRSRQLDQQLEKVA